MGYSLDETCSHPKTITVLFITNDAASFLLQVSSPVWGHMVVQTGNGIQGPKAGK